MRADRRTVVRAAAVGILSAAVAATCAATVLGLLMGRLSTLVAAMALGAGALAGLAVGWVEARHPRRPRLEVGVRIGWWGAATVAAFVFFVWRAFLWHVVDMGGERLVVGSAYNHGDFSLHLALVRHMALGADFWPGSLLLGGHKMAYPLGANLFHALLVLVGLPVLAGFAWMGLASGALTLHFLWRWGGAFAVATFLFAGGLQAVDLIGRPGVRDVMAEWDWKSIPLALFTTQRGLLFALPAGLALLASWRSRCAEDAGRPLPFVVELLLYASLPLFHVHTFLFVSIALAALFLLAPPAARPGLLALGIAAVAPASALVWLVVDIGGGQAAAIAWQPGWMQGDAGALTYWTMNFGLWLPVMALTLFVAWREWIAGRDTAAGAGLAVAGASCLVFLACCLVRFAPWAWDNTKLMLWCFLAIAPVAWRLVLARLALPLRVAAIAVLMVSGIVSLAGGLRPPDPPNTIANSLELDRVGRLLRLAPPNARIATSPDWNHPVILHGRKLALGYDGHLWSHGYDYARQTAALDALMRGGDDWRPHAQFLEATHVFWGPREQQKFGHSNKSWIFDAEVVGGDDTHGVLYRLR